MSQCTTPSCGIDLYDDIIFLASCINDALANKIHRLMSKDRIALGT